jgi:hypothetical protein
VPFHSGTIENAQELIGIFLFLGHMHVCLCALVPLCPCAQGHNGHMLAMKFPVGALGFGAVLPTEITVLKCVVFSRLNHGRVTHGFGL